MYIVSDSSFFICFLDDIQAHQYLLSILEYDLFTFVIGVIIKQELKKSPNYCVIENKIENDFIHFSHYQLSERRRKALISIPTNTHLYIHISMVAITTIPTQKN